METTRTQLEEQTLDSVASVTADLTPVLAVRRRPVRRRRRRPVAHVQCPSCKFRARAVRAAAFCVPCKQLILPLTETDA